MRVEIKQGGDGFVCWNAAAITAYAAAADEREARLARTNPDLVVTPGRIKCYGCQVNDFDLGVRCTAELTRTLYAVVGEVAPRAADAGGSLADIDGLRPRVETTEVERAATAAPASPPAATATPTASTAPRAPTAPTPPTPPQPETGRRSGLGRLLGRRG